MICRRRFGQWVASGLATATPPALAAPPQPPGHGRPLRVAAVQMAPRLADVSANLEHAEHLVREFIPRYLL